MTICICGSARFKEAMYAFGNDLRSYGWDVLLPHLFPFKTAEMEDSVREVVAAGLTLDHFRKIERADVVFIFNPAGYIGLNTAIEIGYAEKCRKPMYCLHLLEPTLQLLMEGGGVDQLRLHTILKNR